MIKKEHRLKKNKQFNFIYNRGSKLHSKNLTLVYVKSKFNSYKVGFSIGKKVGKAHERNKVKRRLREIIRILDAGIPKYKNYVFVAKEGAKEANFTDLKQEVNFLMAKVK